jgi:uncharacterized SAM-binding protein YcdF (DUF218 family)
MKKIIIIVGAIIALFLILIGVGFWKHEVILSSMCNYLVVNEEPKKSDVIIVISGGPGRVEHGAKLYHEGYADWLLLSGSSPLMLRQAKALGVPEDRILVENKSMTTYGNAKYSEEIMQAQGFKSAILVTSPFHTRRAGMIFHQFFSEYDLTVCSIPYDPSICGRWWKDKMTTALVISEYLKLGYYYVFER